jgi:5-methylcytosine-specific restriction endonuclease McrA
MPRKAELRRIRSERRAETYDGVTDAEILERDRWRCGICGKRIGKSFRYPHPRSKSIDHVIPLSEGGDDTAANKRAAHLDCNRRRMNRGGGEQLAMIG